MPSGSPHSSSWLPVVPSTLWACNSSPMSTIKWWLGLSGHFADPCVHSAWINTTLDPLDHHTVTCRHGGDVMCHNHLQDEIFDLNL